MCGILVQSTNEPTIINKFINTMKNIDNRGRECFGISYNNNDSIKNIHYNYRIIDYPKDNENTKDTKDTNKDNIASNNIIGHVRYSTTKNKVITENDINTQPIYQTRDNGEIYTLIHNGNIPNISYDDGRSDTYYITNYINKHKSLDFVEVLKDLLKDIKCAYCLAIMDKYGKIYICKDNFGIRPLYISYLSNNELKNNETGYNGIMISSETSCFQKNNTFRSIKSGEILVIKDGIVLENYGGNQISNICSFEYIYFFGDNHCDYVNGEVETMYSIRYQFGTELAKLETLNFLEKDDIIVIGMPNTGISTGKAFARHFNYNYIQAIRKRENCGRSFILPTNEARNKLLKEKLIYDKEVIAGKIVYIIDDSIVRGNTIRNVFNRLIEFGAKEVHIRISSPPVINPCFYGVDMPNCNELLAYGKTIDEIRDWIGCDTIHYLNIGIISKVLNNYNMCSGCFTGEYPTNNIIQNENENRNCTNDNKINASNKLDW